MTGEKGRNHNTAIILEPANVTRDNYNVSGRNDHYRNNLSQGAYRAREILRLISFTAGSSHCGYACTFFRADPLDFRKF